MNIKHYLDSTYLKTAEQAGISEKENIKLVAFFIQEAIDEQFKLIMIRPEMVILSKEMILNQKSKVDIGTVIDFPNGNASVTKKLIEANQAIEDGANDLDFVCNYTAFKNGEVALVKNEILQCTRLGIENHKVVKWIIEVAALNPQQIIQLSVLIKNVVISNFKETDFTSIYIKSSTGFYKTENNLPNGATLSTLKMMIENGSPLSIKASGGIKSYDDAIEMISLGVKRIGTSSAKSIANHQVAENDY
jgi:deoxyribose-phosphate aldolase